MRPIVRRSLAVAAIGSTALAVTLQTAPSDAAPKTASKTASATTGSTASSGEAARIATDYDARELGAKAAARSRESVAKSRPKAVQRYLNSLGDQVIDDVDPLTRTPRQLTRLDGYLSTPTTGSARTIALDYVEANLATLGLSTADLDTLDFRRDYVDTSGIHHLSWTQSVDGTTVFGNGLQVNVTSTGRVISVLGSPVANLTKLVADASAGDLSAAGARAAAARDVDATPEKSGVESTTSGTDATTTWDNDDYARKVWFLTSTGLRLGWSTYVQTGDAAAYQHVIDAATGATLYRHSTVDKATGDAYVYDYYPGAPKGAGTTTTVKVKKRDKHGHVVKKHGHVVWVTKKRTVYAQGGRPKVVNLIKKGWLSKKATFLTGTSVITWADVNDDNELSSDERTAVPGTKKGATFKLSPFDSSLTGAGKECTAAFVCTWDETTPESWTTNENADATNAFYLASHYHDYLRDDKAIGFTAQAGSFDAKGGDPVLQQVLDGADTLSGLPDGNHIDNANMSTPPDGTPPTMQMYLWQSADGYTPTSGSFDASVLLHEYTHGLSNRLVIDADGNSTLNSLQAGSMGEAWSDYYAMDYLVTHKFQKDTAKDGQVYEGQYLMGGQEDDNGNPIPFRTEPMDCSVGSTSSRCVGAVNGKQGGYTYGDVPTIGGGAEVHSSGEVWAQTLWDIRKAFGHTIADTLITRAMSLSAADPSMLDMRNAILQADLVVYGQSHARKLWKIFAARGMGYFAGTIGGDDSQPAEDFHRPPKATTPHDGVIAGHVYDADHDPVAGVTVTIGGFESQYTTTTGSDGSYEFDDLYLGTYQKVAVTGAGYLGDSSSATAVRAGEFTSDDDTDFTVERDWAATSGGASVSAFDGPDYTDYGCGPAQALDTVLTTGWGSTTGDDAGTPTNTSVPKAITVELPQAIDVSSFQIDPTATCGDGLSASVAGYTIETSTDGSTWTDAAEGTFGVDDRGQLNDVTPSDGSTGVEYVRFTMLSNQTPDFATNCPDGAYSGCSYTDMTELVVLGTPSA
ncbi:MAG: M36 family metallopeptidase [Nocardioides sp.]|uniref:M36 family metallopeptidase n=1 Tax=Nocardioides sp. TaxID=35761 RepID=UPI0039E60817